jgi:hypothetical protein
MRSATAILLTAALVCGGCAAKKKSLADSAPVKQQKVLVLAVDPVGHASVDWPSDVPAGLLFGMVGAAIQANSQAKRDAKLSEKLDQEIGPWMFQPELQKIFLSSATPPAGWTWVDANTLSDELRLEIAARASDRKAKTPLLAAYAQDTDVDLLFIVSASFYGIQRHAGYMVTLNGLLFNPLNEDRDLIRQVYERSPEKDPKDEQRIWDADGPNDGEHIKVRILGEAEKAAARLAADLSEN